MNTRQKFSKCLIECTQPYASVTTGIVVHTQETGAGGLGSTPRSNHLESKMLRKGSNPGLRLVLTFSPSIPTA